MDANAVASWCILRKVDGLFPKIKGERVEAGVFGDKTPLNRRIVRSMSVAGRAGKCIVDDEAGRHWAQCQWAVTQRLVKNAKGFRSSRDSV